MAIVQSMQAHEHRRSGAHYNCRFAVDLVCSRRSLARFLLDRHLNISAVTWQSQASAFRTLTSLASWCCAVLSQPVRTRLVVVVRPNLLMAHTKLIINIAYTLSPTERQTRSFAIARFQIRRMLLLHLAGQLAAIGAVRHLQQASQLFKQLRSTRYDCCCCRALSLSAWICSKVVFGRSKSAQQKQPAAGKQLAPLAARVSL